MISVTPKWVKVLHKYFALLVIIQLLIWLISGFWLARLADTNVPATQLRTQSIALPINGNFKSAKEILEIHKSRSQQDSGLQKETIALLLLPILDTWVYQLTHQKGRHLYWENAYSIYHATTGEPIGIDQHKAKEIATASYAYSPLIKSISLIKPPIADLPKQKNQVWQISMQDEWDTRIYVHAQNGHVIAHKTSHSELKDLLFKLHFMDYSNKGSFNNFFIQFFAIISLLMSASGLYWLSVLGVNKMRKR